MSISLLSKPTKQYSPVCYFGSKYSSLGPSYGQTNLYYYIKENLLSLMSGCLRTPPKLKGLGQWNSDTVFTNVWGVTWVGSFWGSTLRAALRLRKVLENAILRPWHPEFWSCNHEFWVLCSSYWPYEKTLLVLFDTTLRASFRLMEVLENAVLRPWHPKFLSC